MKRILIQGLLCVACVAFGYRMGVNSRPAGVVTMDQYKAMSENYIKAFQHLGDELDRTIEQASTRPTGSSD